FHKLKLPHTDTSSPERSLNELKELENHSAMLVDLEKNLGIDVKAIDSDEKIFVLLDESDAGFSVIRDRENGTITSYTDRPFIYYVDVYDWEKFYQPFSQYLQSLETPFELWKIWEGKLEVHELKRVQIGELSVSRLEELYEMDTYLHPIVGTYD
ncbi:MAG: hypothetical protein ACLTXM_19150, partial [Enterococcus sp.]